MLHVARECGPPRTANSGGPSPNTPSSAAAPHTLLTFGEFCLFSTDLKREYHKTAPRPPQLSRQVSEHNHQDNNITSKLNGRGTKCEVFLGGSCNPTSWRQDEAIPILKDLGISYYNPQVTHWEEALVEKEHIAKNTASVLFFVFDRRTRNVASMVEVSYIAATKRKIMLVLDSYPGPGHAIGGEPLSVKEYEELSGGLNTVQDLVERRGIPVFSQIPHALHCTAKIIQEDLWPQQLGVTDQVTPVRNSHLQPAEKYTKIIAAFDGRSLALHDTQSIFADVVGRPMTHDELMTVVAAKKGVSAGSLSVCSELPLKEIFLTVDEFCCVVAEFSSPKLEQRKLRNVFSNSIVSNLQKAFGIQSPRRSPRLQRTTQDSCALKMPSSPNFRDQPSFKQYHYEIYLGGAIDDTQNWQEKEAIPLLKASNVSYWVAGSSCPRSPHSPEARSFLRNNHVNHSKLTNGVTSSYNKVKSPSKNNHCDGISLAYNHVVSEKETSNHLDQLQVPDDRESRGRLYPSEAAHIDQCRVLLFVVSENTRGVSTMNLAAHYIGLGCNVVLCVQKIPDDAIVNGELLTKAAIKDYNRGRSYLTDLAEKDGVPVFSNIKEAVLCSIQKSKGAR